MRQALDLFDALGIHKEQSGEGEVQLVGQNVVGELVAKRYTREAKRVARQKDQDRLEPSVHQDADPCSLRQPLSGKTDHKAIALLPQLPVSHRDIAKSSVTLLVGLTEHANRCPIRITLKTFVQQGSKIIRHRYESIRFKKWFKYLFLLALQYYKSRKIGTDIAPKDRVRRLWV